MSRSGTGTRPCEGCGRESRASGRTLEEFPGTVLRTTAELCGTCARKRYTRVVRTDHSWRDDAVCATADPDAFFPNEKDKSGIATAIAVCRTCPVRRECAAYATSTKQRVGVWGGKFRGAA